MRRIGSLPDVPLPYRWRRATVGSFRDDVAENFADATRPEALVIFINAAPVRTVRHAMRSLDGLAQDQGRAHDGRAVARGEVYVPFTITALPAAGCSLISHVPGAVCPFQPQATFHAARSNGSTWKSDHPGRSPAARHSALGRTTKGGGSGRRGGWPAQHGERLRDVHPELG